MNEPLKELYKSKIFYPNMFVRVKNQRSGLIEDRKEKANELEVMQWIKKLKEMNSEKLNLVYKDLLEWVSKNETELRKKATEQWRRKQGEIF